MHTRVRGTVLGAIALLLLLGLSSCTPGIPVAYHVSSESVDVAFCETFTAASVEIDFSNYPPPMMGPKYSIAFQSYSGQEAEFGAGRPVMATISDWQAASGNDDTPEDWERVDYTFYDVNGEYAGSELLFSREVTSTDWAWTSGFNVLDPDCELEVD